ncbi:hypothetical protein [Kangiella sp. HZ709]|uniref:hypothetical protein n=1 Tax=Kangiella sp. HZ709 TaxID=2666328 RepID=UPI0012AFDAA8|nr:hypothetical protein [Kangiella sp. HZ709]MRX26575.1 hypothetical protein [Kangiella sp. HZ709]
MKLNTILLLSLVLLPSYAKASYFQLKPSDNAYQQVKQLLPLIGSWSCQSSSLQPDGNWQKTSNRSQWDWKYILNGHAIQDFWYPNESNLEAPGAGTNLRTYDPVKDAWEMVWTFDKYSRFQTFNASFKDNKWVMQGEYPASKTRPAHMARITFYNISNKYFDWYYESSNIGDGKNWMKVAKIACDKKP